MKFSRAPDPGQEQPPIVKLPPTVRTSQPFVATVDTQFAPLSSIGGSSHQPGLSIGDRKEEPDYMGVDSSA